jgi:hypothetical protein
VRWLGALAWSCDPETKIVYFMDDDLFDLGALRGLPWWYRWKVFSRAWIYRSRLKKLCDEMWVASPALAKKYAARNPVLLEMKPSPSIFQRETNPVFVCYHATGTHQREMEWLLPIMQEVLAQAENVHFEVFGTRAINKRFGKLPRVAVLNPMSWPNYLAYASTHKCDIALAPLLPGKFNAARGPTKFYDYSRMGGVGLYSDVAPYRGFIQNGVDGLLLRNEPNLWIVAILALVKDADKRNAMRQAANQRLTETLKSA